MPRKANPNAPKVAAQKLPTGLPYGEHQQLAQQEATPPPPPQNIQPQPGAAPQQQTPDQIQNPFEQAVAAAQQMAPPQGMLGQPTARPDEPVQAGIASGPGPGPNPLSGFQVQTLGQLLNNLAQQPAAGPGIDYLQSAFNGGQV